MAKGKGGGAAMRNKAMLQELQFKGEIRRVQKKSLR